MSVALGASLRQHAFAMTKPVRRWLVRLHLRMTCHDMAVTQDDIEDAIQAGDADLADDLTTYRRALQRQAERLADQLNSLTA